MLEDYTPDPTSLTSTAPTTRLKQTKEVGPSSNRGFVITDDQEDEPPAKPLKKKGGLIKRARKSAIAPAESSTMGEPSALSAAPPALSLQIEPNRQAPQKPIPAPPTSVLSG